MVNLKTESLVVIIGIGVTAGWLGYLVRGTGFGLLGDMAIGIVGALVGDLVLPLTELDAGIGALIVNAALGAVALLLLLMFAAGGRGWRGGLRSGGSNWRRLWLGRW
jgi:uncharacterized membrane protein YeaQ/YmgE (transglycosylase-associated protein family)